MKPCSRPTEGFELSIRFAETPGHTPQDITRLVGTADGTVAGSRGRFDLRGHPVGVGGTPCSLSMSFRRSVHLPPPVTMCSFMWPVTAGGARVAGGLAVPTTAASDGRGQIVNASIPSSSEGLSRCRTWVFHGAPPWR